MSREVIACPECDGTHVHSRVNTDDEIGAHFRADDSSSRWRCRDCGHTFAEPVRRPPKCEGGGRYAGHAGALLRADPDTDLRGGGA